MKTVKGLKEGKILRHLSPLEVVHQIAIIMCHLLPLEASNCTISLCPARTLLDVEFWRVHTYFETADRPHFGDGKHKHIIHFGKMLYVVFSIQSSYAEEFKNGKSNLRCLLKLLM